MVEKSSCPVCSGQFGETLHYLNHEYQNALELQDLEIRVCNSCGLGVAHPERSWTVMEEFYKRSYRASGSAHRDAARSLISQYSVNTRALSQWILLRTFRSFAPNDLFCDIGPGGGATFQTAKFLGLNLKAYAYEPDKFSISSLHRLGVKVYESSFGPQVELPPVKFSAIIMSHVLEHFSGKDSIATLKKIKTMLSEDGVLLCEVPNTPMLTFGKQRIDDSSHLSFWCIEAFKKAFVLAGLRPLYISTAGERYRDWWNRVQLVITKKPGFGSILMNIKKKILLNSSEAILEKTDRFRYIFQGKTPYNYLSSADFDYGTDRVYLRAICVVDSKLI